MSSLHQGEDIRTLDRVGRQAYKRNFIKNVRSLAEAATAIVINLIRHSRLHFSEHRLSVFLARDTIQSRNLHITNGTVHEAL